MKTLFTFLFFFSLVGKISAQKDTIFWFAAPAITSSFGNIYRTPIAFNITTYNLPAIVTISQPSGSMTAKIISIPAYSTQSVSMDSQLDTIESKPSNAVINTGIKISSTSNISVYYENSSFGSPELFGLKGKNALGNNFVISSQTFLENDPGYSDNFSAFSIVATEDNTLVTIIPSYDIVGHLGNIPFNITLNKGQVYVAQGTNKTAGTHLQGSSVNSSKPIAITLIDDMLSGAPFGGCADLIGDQTIPTDIIGTEYVAVKGLLASPFDRLYITATLNGTLVNLNGVYLTSLNAGQTYEIILAGTNTYVQTNLPVYVYQMTGQGCEAGSAILPPISCTGSSKISFVRSTSLDVFVSIVANAASLNDFLVNGVSGVITSADFAVVPGTSNQYYTALKNLPIALFPQNSVVTISNTTSLFQMGVFQGSNTTGNSFGYFTNFNTIQAQASASNTNPCAGSLLQLFSDTVISATYLWTGPNGFTSNLQNPGINNIQAINAGNYILEVSIPGCSVSYDTLSITVGTPPILTATNTLNYCSNCELLWPNLNITSGLGCGNLDTVKVFFTIGYTQGQDTLQFVPMLGINSYFNPGTGVLTLYGNANYSVWQSALQAVCYRSLVPNISNVNASKNVVIVLGDALFNPVNGHFYRLVNNPPSTDWTDAKVKSAQSNYFGLQGYLVTITSSQEDNFISSFFTENVWIGASDSAVEGEWRWVTGCEGLEDGGQGRLFWLGNSTGSSIGGNYSNWYAGNPSNTSNEDVANKLYPYGYTWNDANWATPYAYVIEYGCMPGDPVVNIIGNATINLLPSSDTVINYTICQGQSYMGYSTTTSWSDTLTSAGGCDSIIHYNLTVNPLPNVTASGTNAICIGQQQVTLSGSGAASYTWSAGVINGMPFTLGATTTFTVTGTDANGCSNTTTKLVTVNALPSVSALASPNDTLCIGNNITLSGNGAFTYTWSGGVMNNSPFTINNSTTYTVTGTDANGCSNTASILVNVNSLPTITANGPNTVCAGQSATLFGSGATLYAWSGGISNNVSFIPTATTTYTIIGTDANGCSNSATKLLTVNPLPIVNSTPVVATVCLGQSMTLNGTGASTYTWSGGVMNNSPFTINNTTTYTVTGTDANGCSATNTKLVTVNALPNVNSISTPPSGIVCAGNSVTLSGTGAFTYTWSGGVNNGVSFIPASTATYTLTGTDANGCINTNTKSITVNSLPTITIGSVPNPAIICIGNAVTFTANGANLYAWSGGLSNGISFNPTSSSTYTVTGTDANNCNNTNTISLTVNPLPNVNSTPALATICFGQSMTLNGTGATTYTWSGGVLNNIPFTINNSTTYTVTGTDANGCSNTNTKLVTVNPLPTISVLPSNPAICLNQSVNLTAGGASSYVWSPATGLNQTTGATVSASPTGSTSYTITGTSVNGCSNTISNTVTINPLPALSATPSSATICIGDSVTLNMNGANTYSWFPTAGLNQSTGPQVKASPNTTTTYTITGTNANGCTNTQVVTVTVNPSYNRYDTLDLCQGMSYTFGSQTITTSGNYINTYQSGLSCDSTVNLHVKVYDKPVSNFSLDEHACANESIQIQSNWQSPQASYLWDVGDGILSGNTQVVNVVWTIPGTKIVSLEVATQSPCMPEKFIDTIEVHQPQANIKVSDADTFFCIYDQVKLQTPNLNGYSYLWSPATYFNSTSYIAEGVVKEPVSVKVNVKDQWGCEAEDSKYLNVQPCCNAYLPNSFTPNGDGLNDIFRIIGEGNYHVLDFYVANRWGNIVFRTINQNEGWDGKIQGIEQSTDTYYYFLNYECSNGQKRFIKGDLLLLR